MIVGVDTASSRWHAVGRAEWMPAPGFQVSRWTSKKGNADQNRQPLAESFRRFLAAAVALRDLMRPDDPLHLFVEHPLSLRNPKTNLALGMAAGAIEGQHYEFDLYWWWVQITSWQTMVGVVPGKDTSEVVKAKSRAYAMEHLLLPGDLDEDHYDAANVGLWGERQLAVTPEPWLPGGETRA